MSTALGVALSRDRRSQRDTEAEELVIGRS